MIYDITIVGNGIIGTTITAELLKKFPQKKILLVGPIQKSNSASLAAGAMHAVFGEVEHTFNNNVIEKEIFKFGLYSRELWKKVFKDFKMKNIITSNDTILYCHKNRNLFEIKNFNAAVKVATKYNVISDISNTQLKKYFDGFLNYKEFNAVKLNGEFSFNIINLFKNLEKFIKSKDNYTYINSLVSKVDYQKNLFTIYTKDKIVIKSKKVIVTAGFGSSEIDFSFFNPIPLIKGVGSAFLINLPSKNFFNGHVIRTSNRGGSSCGLHIVPYDKNNNFYVGAGNYLSDKKFPLHRLETFNYLNNLLSNELINKKNLYKSNFYPILGYRPISIDKIPSIGGIKNIDNFFYISGFNRVGLTLASYLSKVAQDWIDGKKLEKNLSYFNPDRTINNYSSEKKSLNDYIELNMANLNEHSILNQNNKVFFYNKLKKNFYIKNKKAKFKSNININFPPDTLGLNFIKIFMKYKKKYK